MPTARIWMPAQTTFGDYPGSVPTLTAGTIEQSTPQVGDTLTVSGSNAPAGSTYLWQVDTGGGFGAAGGTNNAASYDTTGRPAGDYRRGVSTPAQSVVYTSAVAVAAGGITITSLTGTTPASGSNGPGSFDTHYTVSGIVSGERIIVGYHAFDTNCTIASAFIDPAGSNTSLTIRQQTARSGGPNVALLDGVAGASGSLVIRLTGTANRPNGSITVLTAGVASFQQSAKTDTNRGFPVTITSTGGGEGLVAIGMINTGTGIWNNTTGFDTMDTFTVSSRDVASAYSSDVGSGIVSIGLTHDSTSATTVVHGVYE
jgi:hypothetical protein